MNRTDSDPTAIDLWKRRITAAPPDLATRTHGAVLALGASSRFAELESLFAAALACGVSAAELTEGTLAVHLFGGFPRAIEAYFRLSAAGGVDPSQPDGRDPTTRRQDGAALFANIYGRQSQAVRDQLGVFGPDFHAAVIEDAYGRVLSRPALPGVRRELAAVCALAALGLDRQLFSHLRGAVALGAANEEIRAMVALAGEITPAFGGLADATLRRALGESGSSAVTRLPE